ncbi:hypothetical protein IGI37_002561 [Enterococcus sp. AZ194]|uniref:hypothetical protein n=1 Tax=Enterococcus sp. AZ194 TaxID=2774629 RepID=UPI003F213F4C
MKKIGFVILLGSMFLVGLNCGLRGNNQPKTDISQQEYKITLEDAIQLYQKETKLDSCTALSFDTMVNTAASHMVYEYVFENGETIIHINSMTGEVTKSKQKREKKSPQKQKIHFSELTHLPMPKEAMSQALERVRGHNKQVVSWRVQQDRVNPSYTVTVKQNHAQKRVLVESLNNKTLDSLGVAD